MSKYNNIWLYSDFDNSRKTRRLKRLVGKEGAYCLLMLFLYAGNARPNGVLSGLSKEDIAEESGWISDYHYDTLSSEEREKHIDEFIEALLKSNHLKHDKETDTYIIPSFGKRQPHLQPEYQQMKIDRAKKAGNARWGRTDVDLENCPWLEKRGEYINVDVNKLPDNMIIEGEYYKNPAAFREVWFNRDGKEKNRLGNLISRSTKQCECGKLFVNDVSDKCYKCERK